MGNAAFTMLKPFRRLLEEEFELYSNYGKRFFDIVFSLIAVISLFPLFAAIAVLIKLFDSGPIIFCQKRVGINGKNFDFYKFRSMPVNTGDVPSDQLSNVRISWIGKLIRRTNIDELPQLFNIIKGDMSIVGPRPPITTQKELIELRRQNGAILCRPGLTGLAQISSFDGMNPSEKADFDGTYAMSISFKSDLCIIIKTFGYLLRRPPVY